MSRINSGTIALFAAAIIAAALLVLYVIRASPVHETIPGALSALTADPAPKPMPATSFLDAHNRPESLAQFKGRVVILNMWAIWCAPCVRELPALAHLQGALPGLTIVAVNEGRETAADTTRFLKAHGADALHVYLDPDHAFLEALGVQGLPLSVLIDTRGMERARASGPAEWDDPAAVTWLREVTAPADNRNAP